MAALTLAQLNALAAAVIADPVAGPLQRAPNPIGLLAWLNAPSATLGWNSSVPVSDVDEAPSYTSYDTFTQGKRDSWVRFLAAPRDFTKAKVRNWVVDVWGAATAASNSESILQAGTVPCTNAQLLLGGVSKTTGTVTALNRSWDGTVSEGERNQIIWNADGTPRLA